MAGQHTGWMPCEQGPSPHPEEAREDGEGGRGAGT